MAYDEALAQRIRHILGVRTGIMEKKMFGGLAFLLDSRMFCGIVKNDLMVRVGPDRYEQALAEPHARPMDFTGRPLAGMVYVDAKGYRSDAALAKWVERGVRFVATLPAEDSASKSRRRPQRK